MMGRMRLGLGHLLFHDEKRAVERTLRMASENGEGGQCERTRPAANKHGTVADNI